MTRAYLALCVLSLTVLTLLAQAPASTLGLEQGTLDFETKDFTLKLVKACRLSQRSSPKAPAVLISRRPIVLPIGQQIVNSIGDLTFRARVWNIGPWQDYFDQRSAAPR
jgi:hypothetical protein